jgi:GTP cyclohydrolase I
MTHQIAASVQEYLDPLGVGVHVMAQHQCMACRGVKQPDADMVTTTVLGIVRDNPSLKDEFIAAVHNAH